MIHSSRSFFPGGGFFNSVLKKHNCDFKSTNIAIGGTTTGSWDKGRDLDKLKTNAKDHDYVWITLGGNDAIAEMPACASKGKTAPECGDELMATEKTNMGVIIEAAVAANPNIKILGFGYDIMFGGLGCEAIARSIFPQCWKGSEKKVECFNTQFVRIQELWEDLKKSYPKNVDTINILGTCQARAARPCLQFNAHAIDRT